MVNLEKAKLRFSEQCPEAEHKEGVTRQLAEAATTPRIIWTHLPLALLHPDLLKTCKVSLLINAVVNNTFLNFHV